MGVCMCAFFYVGCMWECGQVNSHADAYTCGRVLDGLLCYSRMCERACGAVFTHMH